MLQNTNMSDGENKLLSLFMFYKLLFGGRIWVCISFWKIEYQENLKKKRQKDEQHEKYWMLNVKHTWKQNKKALLFYKLNI